MIVGIPVELLPEERAIKGTCHLLKCLNNMLQLDFNIPKKLDIKLLQKCHLKYKITKNLNYV